MSGPIQAVCQPIENIPGYNIAMDVWGDVAGDYLQTKDPFYVKLPSGEEVRRKAPENISKRDKKVWKRIISKAWAHDRCFCGCTGKIDLGLGQAPLINLIPVIGPIWMYILHGRILSMADELQAPADLQAKISSNILFDFLISIIPVLGSLFSWMNACSTRNAALIDTFLRKRAIEEQKQRGPFELVEERQYDRHYEEVERQRNNRDRYGPGGPGGGSNGGAGRSNGRPSGPPARAAGSGGRKGTTGNQESGYL